MLTASSHREDVLKTAETDGIAGFLALIFILFPSSSSITTRTIFQLPSVAAEFSTAPDPYLPHPRPYTLPPDFP